MLPVITALAAATKKNLIIPNAKVATGRVIGSCHRQFRHQEFIRFLNQIDREVPAEFDVHLVMDNYATHKAPKVAAWFKKHPRYHLHFTPTSSSRLNQVKRWFAKITDDRIRRSAFKCLADLEKAILGYIEANNKNPKPFVWTATADLIWAVSPFHFQEMGRAFSPIAQRSLTWPVGPGWYGAGPLALTVQVSDYFCEMV